MSGIKRGKLSPEANRVLFVKNLPFKIKNDELYDIFGKYGPIRQIRLGNAQGTRGTAYVVYEDVYDAKAAFDHLSGFSVAGRYLVCGYLKQSRAHDRVGGKKEDDPMKPE